ncbi:MAG: competence/damage-inducible protein A [Thermacetogeniaceae bacterium]|jgi:nicotinamide-nucleotide amidase|nr:competence/damage-inducible protein A [Syntrophomonadaceae bacterium]
MTVKVEIIAIGSELLSEEVKNTTTPFLVNQLTALGYTIKKLSTVDDQLEEITGAVYEALRRANLIFLTGGLGSTPDDLTREAVAEALKMPMEFRDDLWEEIQQFFLKKNRDVPPVSMKQAYLPCGTLPLRNSLGSAPGILVPYSNDQTIIVLPGPPQEAREMFIKEVKPYLLEHYPPLKTIKKRILKIIGIGETVVYEKLKYLVTDLQNSGIICSFLPMAGEVWLIFKWDGSSKKQDDLFQQSENEMIIILGDDLYGYDDETLSGKVGELLVNQGFTVGVAESCTAGLVASNLTDVPGSSRYVQGGIVAYSNEIKEKLLGVNHKTIEQYGAISPETAREMARGARTVFDSTFGLATTGLAGPHGESGIPVGTVYLGLSTPDAELAQKIFFPGVGRLTLKTIAAKRALDFLRRYLINPDGVDSL